MEAGRGGGGGPAPSSSSSSSNNNNGWPLGLQPLHLQMNNNRASSREQHLYNGHHLRFWGEASPFFISTPSISSLSSSDLDTESTGSFFPERSTTLGTLIGIHTRSQRNQPAMDNVTAKLLQSKYMKKTQRLHACWCAFTLVMRCSCSSTASTVGPNEEDSLSPSLAHLLEIERRAAAHHSQGATSQQQCDSLDIEDIAFEGVEGHSHHHANEITLLDGIGEHSHHTRENTLFNDDGILPPPPSGAPLKSVLHHHQFITGSPSSTDWSARVPIARKRKQHYHAVNGRSHASLCPSFWWKVG